MPIDSTIAGLIAYGVPEDKARALSPYQAVGLLSGLREKNRQLSECGIDVLLTEMRRHEVDLLRVGDGWKLKSSSVEGEKWMLSVLPTLRLRKAEIVAAVRGEPADPDGEQCKVCLGRVYDKADAAAVCGMILSCPMRVK